MLGEQRIGHGHADFGHDLIRSHAALAKQHSARERIAVGVQTGRLQADEHITRANRLSVNELMLVDDADNEASDVVLAGGIEAGHFGGLSAEQRAAVVTAGAGDAGHDLFGDVGRQFSRREIVEEEEGPCTLNEDVVDAVIDEIGTYRVVPSGHERDLELRADAISARHHHRILNAVWHLKKPAE
jgi:hypothetical protein